MVEAAKAEIVGQDCVTGSVRTIAREMFYARASRIVYQGGRNGRSPIETEPVPGGVHPESGPGMQLIFSVPDIEEAAKRIVELGGEVDAGSREGPGGRCLHSCRDEPGLPFRLHEV